MSITWLLPGSKGTGSLSATGNGPMSCMTAVPLASVIVMCTSVDAPTDGSTVAPTSTSSAPLSRVK